MPFNHSRYTLLTVLAVLILCVAVSYAGSDATITGLITDQSGGVIPGATVVLTNINTNVSYPGETNNVGIYRVGNLLPGVYRANVSKDGFKSVIKGDIELHVQDEVSINFELQVGSVSESMTVEGGVPLLNTESAAVSTVVDRQFVENLPMNGRSFQPLIQMTPGVVATTNNLNDGGQFSINGQRGASNYWTVDGVSANIGIAGLDPGNGYAGSLGAFNATGGTNGLVSLDALQEFRIQTSTYAPEFGRTPGAQISIATRSGTNQFHGTVFDYLRNDALDANDWFGNAYQLPKPREQQNDFGGTIGGPIIKNRTFFFFSYEGLRLNLPIVTETNVPDLAARQNAVSTVQDYMNAFPLPTAGAPDDKVNGISQFFSSSSSRATSDAYSIRIDHQLSKKITLFGRYNYSPSQLLERGEFGTTMNTLSTSPVKIHTATVGATWTVSPTITNDFRFNYSRTNASDTLSLDSLGGAVVPASVPLPSPYTTQNADLLFAIYSLGNNWYLGNGKYGHSLQRQINLVDNFSVQRGSHSLKFGVDFRRMSPVSDYPSYSQQLIFFSVAAAATGVIDEAAIIATKNASLLFRNLGFFAQDTWRVLPRLTLTYGLRWDTDFAPSPLTGPGFPAVTGFNVNNLSNLALAPVGTPPYKTPYNNVAPRVGVAYQLTQNQNWTTVLHGGFGVFYDLATSEFGNVIGYSYPFGSLNLVFGAPFPVTTAPAATPAPITPESLPSAYEPMGAMDPNLKSPYTLEWNVAMEQALGRDQSITASYIGSAGRRLLASMEAFAPNSNFSSVILTSNVATSSYNALQLRFQRRLSRGLQALASYTWAHSIDDASAGSTFTNSNAVVPGINQNANRGPSDFDIRHTFTAGITYDIPAPKGNALANAILHGWSTENVIQVRSALPVNVYDNAFYLLFSGLTAVRPDVVPGVPLYVTGSQCVVAFGSPCPGGKGLNPAAFAAPPTDAQGNPLRQGDLGRNALRGFGAAQWDFAVHRDFPIRESVKLQFRAEMFNVLNHPNFAPPVTDISNTTQFGRSTQMLNSYLGANLGNGGFSSLYQLGGPRSIQLALKLIF